MRSTERDGGDPLLGTRGPHAFEPGPASRWGPVVGARGAASAREGSVAEGVTSPPASGRGRSAARRRARAFGRAPPRPAGATATVPRARGPSSRRRHDTGTCPLARPSAAHAPSTIVPFPGGAVPGRCRHRALLSSSGAVLERRCPQAALFTGVAVPARRRPGAPGFRAPTRVFRPQKDNRTAFAVRLRTRPGREDRSPRGYLQPQGGGGGAHAGAGGGVNISHDSSSGSSIRGMVASGRSGGV